MKELTRRGFVVAASLAGLSAATRAFPDEPGSSGGGGNTVAFNHGVASGDPLHDRVILWTRVTPKNLAQTLEVKWRVGRDPLMKRVLGSSVATTDASRDFTVKIDVK